MLQEVKIMDKKKFKQVLVHVPESFLEEFDKKTTKTYMSRNEAIRTGMLLLLEKQKIKNN